MHIWDERYVTMTRGDTMSFGIEIEGLNKDLDTAFFTCKKNISEAPVFRKTLGQGITKIDEGKYVVRIVPSDTANLDPGRYFYDLELGANGDRFTFLKGLLEIQRNITD